MLDVYGIGFRDGVRAAVTLFPALLAGIIDDAEMIARPCGPDALPQPDGLPTAEMAEA